MTEPMIYRAIEPVDAALLCQWFNDDKVNFGSNMKIYPHSIEQIRGDISKGAYRSSSRIGILALVGELPIGLGTIYSIDRLNGKAEVGIVIGNTDYWNKGYASKIVYELVRICFEGMGLNRVYFNAYEYNRASTLLLSMVGLTFEGVIRESFYRGDRFWDKSLFSILSHEWRERKEELRLLAGV